MGLEKLDENSLLNCRRYIEQSLLDIENLISRLSNIKTPYGDVNDLIMSSRSNIRNVENELNNLYYKLGSDIIGQIDNIDVNFIPTDDLLAGYDYFKETSDTPLEDYILYVLENGSIDDILELCDQIYNSSTKYLLDKKDKDAVYHFELEDGSIDTWTKSEIIDYLLWGVICDSNFPEEQLNFFRESVNKDFFDEMFSLGNRYSQGCYGLAKFIKENTPDNYSDFNFDPSNYVPKPSGVGSILNPKYTPEYNLVTNWHSDNVAYKETFIIKGHNVTVIQIFPGIKSEGSLFADISLVSTLERRLYDIYKAAVINKLDSIPKEVFETFDNDLTIMLPYDKSVSNNVSNGNWSGYYCGDDGCIWLDEISNDDLSWNYIINGTVQHEIGHKFDYSYSNNFANNFLEFMREVFISQQNIEGIIGTSQYTVFKDYAQKYAVEVDSIEHSGYTPDTFKNNVVEFFACSFEAYINNPDELKTLCPEVYDAIEQMIGGTF